jgi:hypothetical protein
MPTIKTAFGAGYSLWRYKDLFFISDHLRSKETRFTIQKKVGRFGESDVI